MLLLSAVPATPDIATILTSFFTLAGGLLAMYSKSKKEADKRVQKLLEDNDVRAKLILDEMVRSINDVKTFSDVNMQKLNGMLTYVIHSFDRPAWLKVARRRGDGEIEFRMLEMNDLYAEIFGISRSDYLGKTDLEAGWDKTTAEMFRQHDLSVWASGEPTTYTEVVKGVPARFRKIRVSARKNVTDGPEVLKGVFAYAVDCSDPDGCPMHRHGEPIQQPTIEP
jgi:PAS domain-containing protein